MEECPEELPAGDIGSSGGKRKGVCGNEARGQQHANMRTSGCCCICGQALSDGTIDNVEYSQRERLWDSQA